MRGDIIKKIMKKYDCQPGAVFSFNSNTKIITYIPEELEEDSGILALLHEIAHLELGHFTYTYDVELLDIEVEAWDMTRELATKYGIKIDEEHIVDCLSSYDSWISKRATCPECGEYSLQRTKNVFGCFVCDCHWKVNENKMKGIRKRLISKK